MRKEISRREEGEDGRGRSEGDRGGKRGIKG